MAPVCDGESAICVLDPLTSLQRGHEWDVVRTIMKLCESKPGHILSVSASPSSRGSVYVETVSLPDVDRIIRDVAFIRRRVAPEKIPLQEYEAILKVSDAPEILATSWARYTGRGDYCGDLVWVESYDPDAMSYVVYVVPRTLRWDTYKAKPAGLKRPRRPSRVPAALLLPSHVGLSCVADHLVQFDGSAYQHGFLVLDDVPARQLTDQDVVPSLDELDVWQQSPLYHTLNDIEILRLDSTVDSSYVSLASSFSESVRKKNEWLKTVCIVEEGDRVRVVHGEWKDMVGEAVNVDSTARLVTVHITDFAGPSLDIPFPFTALMVDYRVGDFVEIRSGLHTGVRGWVDTVDWNALRVGMLEHMYTPDATGRKTMTDEAAALEVRQTICVCKLPLTLCIQAERGLREYIARANGPVLQEDESMADPIRQVRVYRYSTTSLTPLQWDVAIASLRPMRVVQELGTVAADDQTKFAPTAAPSSSPCIPPARADPYIHFEVKIYKGPLRGLYGTIKNTSSDGTKVAVATEGRAVNSLVHVEVGHVRERQSVTSHIPNFVLPFNTLCLVPVKNLTRSRACPAPNFSNSSNADKKVGPGFSAMKKMKKMTVHQTRKKFPFPYCRPWHALGQSYILDQSDLCHRPFTSLYLLLKYRRIGFFILP